MKIYTIMSKGTPPQNPLNQISQTSNKPQNVKTGQPVPVSSGGVVQAPTQPISTPVQGGTQASTLPLQKSTGLGGLPPLKDESIDAAGKDKKKTLSAGGSGSRGFCMIVILLIIILLGSLGFIGYSIYNNSNSSVAISIQELLSGIGLDLNLGGDENQVDTQPETIPVSNGTESETPTNDSSLDPGLQKFMDSFSATDYEVRSSGTFEYSKTETGEDGVEHTSSVTLDLDNGSVYFRKGEWVLSLTDKGASNEQKFLQETDGSILMIDDNKKEFSSIYDPSKPEEAVLKDIIETHPIIFIYQGLVDGSLSVKKLSSNEYQTELYLIDIATGKKTNFPVTFFLDSISNINRLTTSDESGSDQGVFTFSYIEADNIDDLLTIPEDYTEEVI